MILPHVPAGYLVSDIEPVHIHEIIHHPDVVVFDRIQFQTDYQDVLVTLYVFSLNDVFPVENYHSRQSLVVFYVLGEGETFEYVRLRQIDDNGTVLPFRFNYPFAVRWCGESLWEVGRL